MAEKILNSPKRSRSTSSRVLSALSLFGSLQVLVIVCSVIRNKFIALWLGTAGIGLFALYNYTLDLINQLCQLNLRQSAVREIAAEESGKGSAVGMVRKVSVWLGTVGALATLLLSPLLSYWTFGDYCHTFGFVILSLGVGLSAVSSGEQAILQASDKLRSLARGTAVGALSATAISILLFRLFGMKSIVPSLLVFFFATSISYILLGRKNVKSQPVPTRSALTNCRPMLKLGLYMTAGTALASLASYVFIAWLRANAGETGVGIYQAGYVIINQYVGLVFMALGIEYFPRISRVAKSTWRAQVVVRHEVLIIMLVMLAASVVFITAAPLIVRILYSSDFDSIVPYLSLAAVGTIFKALSFTMAYLIVARGDGRTYLLTEFISAAVFLVLSFWGWKSDGYFGLGVAYLVWYALYTVSVAIVCRYRYGVTVSQSGYLLALMVIGLATLQCFNTFNGWHIAALAESIVCVAISGLFLYRLLKRNTLKE